MRDLIISVGNSCKSKHWKNELISFDDLCSRLSNTLITAETIEEYDKMSKEEKGKVKDKGGFVGGALEGSLRQISTKKYRSMLTLDVDNASAGFLGRYLDGAKYTSFIYSTHSHRPNKPRLRIIIPLSRDVTPDEYVALSRLFAAEWDINQFDPCSFRVNQLMYWPTTSKNGEFLCKRVDVEWLNPDTYLSAYPNWKDITTLPIAENENAVKNTAGKKQQDPLTKEGIIGVFCRTYPISLAISTFLNDIYEETIYPNKYTYKLGSSSAGLIVYEDKFAYSHHATDPASGQLLNAFDLVRIHKFGDLEDKDSVKAMHKFASEDDNVKLQILEERTTDASTDFGGLDNSSNSWKTKLTYQPKTALLENTTQNLILILENDPDLKGFAYNDFVQMVEIVGDIPWDRPNNRYWTDADTNQLKALIDKRYLSFTTRNHDVSFAKVVHDRHFHPLKEYLESLPKWDGVKRVDNLFIKYFDAEDNDYVRAVTRKVFTACVARIFNPGTKFDSILVLDGEQGIGKSSIIKYLAGSEFFSDALNLTDMNDKTSAEKLQGFWLIEIAELAGMKKADVEKVKSFISCTDDKYRASYGRVVESHPRQCVIFATVNGERGYLRDITGNRRFWILKLNRKEFGWTWKEDKEFRDQFWAECIYYFNKGEKLYLEGKVLDVSKEEQRKAIEQDERAGIVVEYLNKKLPANWDNMDLPQRREFLNGDELSPKGTVERTKVCNMEIWCECLGRNPAEIKPVDSYQIAAIMAQIGGWEKQNTPRKVAIYGNQRLYVKQQ